MAAPRLYLIVLEGGRKVRVSSCRSFEALAVAANLWVAKAFSDRDEEPPLSNLTVLLHCALACPQLAPHTHIRPPDENVQVLYTDAMKWFMPEEYKGDERPACEVKIDGKSMPCYRVANRWTKAPPEVPPPGVDFSASKAPSGSPAEIHRREYLPFDPKVASKPLIDHLESALQQLDGADQAIVRERLGASGRRSTLEQVAARLDLTRERVRQRQKKITKRILAEQPWPGVIDARVEQMLEGRAEPLILEAIDAEDAWFKGFRNYAYLANTLQEFSEIPLQVIHAHGSNVVTRITRVQWDALLKELRAELKEKARGKRRWTRGEIGELYQSSLANFRAAELAPVLESCFVEHLRFSGIGTTADPEANAPLFEDADLSEDDILVAYARPVRSGRSVRSAVGEILETAEKPLHFTEIAQRAAELLERKVGVRVVHNEVVAQGAFLFDRGTYGKLDHCPLSGPQREKIREQVEAMMTKDSVQKQWHSREIIELLRGEDRERPDPREASDAAMPLAAFAPGPEVRPRTPQPDAPGPPDALNPYVLAMCLRKSRKIASLNRMVWARADSRQQKEDRLNINEVAEAILEEAGCPLTHEELREKISKRRGVSEYMQLHKKGRLIQVRPDAWGLKGRDDELSRS